MARSRWRVRALSIGVLLGVGAQCGVDEMIFPPESVDLDAGPDGWDAGTGASGSTGGGGGAGMGGEAGASGAAGEPGGVPEPGLKVALFGDQGLSADAQAVLRLVKRERADFVIHLGDFDYTENPEAWEAQIDEALGADFPYFAAVGNHDVYSWTEYQKRLVARSRRTEGARCKGDYGVQSVCRYRGLFFLLSGVGTLGEAHESFLESALSGSRDLWKICAWHKNQHDMQTGLKSDEVGWEAYQTCQQHGALIATAHEHAYARTFTVNNLGSQAAQHGPLGDVDRMTVTPGRTFVVVAGLGGYSIRDFLHEQRVARWWASVYTNDLYLRNGELIEAFEPAPGALFLEFNVDGDPERGRGYFKNIRYEIIDSFEMVAGTGR